MAFIDMNGTTVISGQECATYQQIDADGDGVTDVLDLCPNTTAGVTVDATGCEVVGPTDSDGDGVVMRMTFAQILPPELLWTQQAVKL